MLRTDLFITLSALNKITLYHSETQVYFLLCRYFLRCKSIDLINIPSEWKIPVGRGTSFLIIAGSADGQCFTQICYILSNNHFNIDSNPAKGKIVQLLHK